MGKNINFIYNFHLKTSTTPPNRLFGVNKRTRTNRDFAPPFAHFNSKISKVIIVLFLVLGFSMTQAIAQRDQITTQAGEKIRCRILDETPNRFIYAYLSPAGKVLRNEIFKNLVTDFKYNFYSSDIVTKGSKMPDGLGGARQENTTTTERIDTRKTEPSKSSTTKKESKKSNEKVPEKARQTASDKVTESKTIEEKTADKTLETAEKVGSKTTETTKKEEKSSSKTAETTKKEEKVANKTTETSEKGSGRTAETGSKKTTKATPKTTKKEVVKREEPKVKEEKTVTPMNTQKDNNEFSNYLKWRVGVRGGFGNMLAKIDTKDEFGLYQEKLLRGWTWGADASYFFTDHVGVGLMFNNFQSQNKADNIKYKNIILNEDATGNISNKRSTKFVGPVLYYRKNIDFKTMVVLGVAPGVYLFNDKGTYGTTEYKFKGLDFGAAATLGVDFLLGNDITGRDIILSLEAGYNYGKMRALDLGGGKGAVNLPTPIDLSRVDFTVGLRFTRYPKYFKLTSY